LLIICLTNGRDRLELTGLRFFGFPVMGTGVQQASNLPRKFNCPQYVLLVLLPFPSHDAKRHFQKLM
jgi:hypothetical protein